MLNTSYFGRELTQVEQADARAMAANLALSTEVKERRRSFLEDSKEKERQLGMLHSDMMEGYSAPATPKSSMAWIILFNTLASDWY